MLGWTICDVVWCAAVVRSEPKCLSGTAIEGCTGQALACVIGVRALLQQASLKHGCQIGHGALASSCTWLDFVSHGVAWWRGVSEPNCLCSIAYEGLHRSGS